MSSCITLASYNMHKAVGLDGRRDPHRVLQVLQEIDADVVALQEADKRVGGRGSTVPHELIDSHGMYKPVHLGVRHKRTLERVRKHTDRLLKVNTRNIGWHGNAILVKDHVGVLDHSERQSGQERGCCPPPDDQALLRRGPARRLLTGEDAVGHPDPAVPDADLDQALGEHGGGLALTAVEPARHTRGAQSRPDRARR